MVADSTDNDNPKAIAVVKEDVLENCWMAPPQLVYSQTDTDSTILSTVSGITDSTKFPPTVTPATQGKGAWDALVERTDALEKAAEDIAKMEKATKEALETQQVEADGKHKAALAAAKKKQKDALKALEEKRMALLNDFKQQSVEDTSTLILVNFDKILEESEKIKAKSKEMEEW
eukprot:8683177-Ditylum_brightwellii.AAC.1